MIHYAGIIIVNIIFDIPLRTGAAFIRIEIDFFRIGIGVGDAMRVHALPRLIVDIGIVIQLVKILAASPPYAIGVGHQFSFRVHRHHHARIIGGDIRLTR